MTEKGTGAARASTATAAPVVRSDAVPSSPTAQKGRVSQW